MIGGTVGDIAIGAHSATGRVTGLTARQAGYLNLHARWGYEGTLNANDLVFLTYMDGELQRRELGHTRNAHLIAPNPNPHLLNVMAWRAYQDPPDEDYGAIATTRAHLEWTRHTDTTIAGYQLWHSTDNITFTVYADHTTTALQTGIYVLTSGAVATIIGNANGTDDTNALYTITVTNAAASLMTVTSDTGYSATMKYIVGTPIEVVPGVQVMFSSAPANADAATFILGVLPEYNTAVLASGTHYFKIGAIDAAGNPCDEGDLDDAIPITITPAPTPLQAFELGYDESTDEITFTATQSASADADTLVIYSNYDSTMGTLLDDIIYDAPLFTMALATGITVTDEVLLDATSLPAGTYRFVPRAVTTAGIDDQTSVEYTMEIPYIPAALVTPYDLTATPTANGGVDLTWLATEDAPGGWEISATPDSGTLPTIETPAPGVAFNTDTFSFTVSLTAADIGTEDTYTVSVRAANVGATRFGTPATVEVTTDSTPPTAPTGLRGVPF